MSSPSACAVFVIGTRAQLIKMAPVLVATSELDVPHTVLFTGQHAETIGDIISEFRVTSRIVFPDQVRERSSLRSLLTWFPGAVFKCWRFLGSSAAQRGKSMVIVHGDTLSALVGAIAASLRRITVLHVESGLTSRRMFDPFPEEIIRRLVFRLTDVAACPNDDAVRVMRQRSVREVIHTGENTLLDALRMAISRRHEPNPEPSQVVVVSVHRFSNIFFPRRLAEIVSAVCETATTHNVVFVLHPATKKRLMKHGLLTLLEQHPRIKVAPRAPYGEFLPVLAEAFAVITDGGSNQEELSYLGVPTLLLRQSTERPDGLGCNIRFEHQFRGGVAEFIKNAGSFRTPSNMDSAAQPSRLIGETIARILSR